MGARRHRGRQLSTRSYKASLATGLFMFSYACLDAAPRYSRSISARLHRRRFGRNPSGMRRLRRLRVPDMRDVRAMPDDLGLLHCVLLDLHLLDRRLGLNRLGRRGGAERGTLSFQRNLTRASGFIVRQQFQSTFKLCGQQSKQHTIEMVPA
jgi:hypothetical protein